jgi:hypothetical protein
VTVVREPTLFLDPQHDFAITIGTAAMMVEQHRSAKKRENILKREISDRVMR